MPAKIYDWDAWFRRGRFRLLRGKDYHCGQSVMGQQIRNAAHRLGFSVTLVEGDGSFNVVARPLERGVKEKAHAA